MIGPVKEEDEWDRPRIVRYHDIVTEKEMERVKELAKPRVSPHISSVSKEPAKVSCGLYFPFNGRSTNTRDSETVERIFINIQTLSHV